jgi:hypothetical protein
MWKFVYASVQGTSHIRTGQPCQDYCSALTTETSEGPILLAACADGAGSAELSDVGSKLAVTAFLDAALEAIRTTGIADSEAVSKSMKGWADAARSRLHREAEYQQLPVRQFACTLLAAVVSPSFSVFTQIGDGVIVVNIYDSYSHVFWPDNGEYANMTHFLTEDNYEPFLRTDLIRGSVSELAMLTDGLQMLALNKASNAVHVPFFKPMFETLRRTLDGQTLENPLRAFLDSSRVNERTDDDKTLLLATREAATDHVPDGVSQVD